jgi:mono/diheme cytochrome c family protein
MLGLTLALLLLLTPVAAFAQDDEEPNLEEFVSDDELLSVMMPADWFQPEASDFPFPAAFMLNSEEAAADPNADAMPGVKGVFAIVVPLDALAMFGGTAAPTDATLTELGDYVVGVFASPDEDATEEEIAATQIGEAEEVELADGVTAAAVEVSTLHEDGVYFVRELGEGVIGLVYTAAYTGEFDDAQLELGRQAAASLSYQGTAEDLMAALMAPPEVEESDVNPATLDGEALVSERCTVCHTRQRIDAANKDEAGWTATVDRMIGHGAQLDSAERQAVIDYLVATH